MFLYISEPFSTSNFCCFLDPLLGASIAMSGRLWLLHATEAKFFKETDNSYGLSEKAWGRYMRRRWRDYCWQLEISIEGADLSAWNAGSERAQMQWLEMKWQMQRVAAKGRLAA
jgi:hypothetical protein